MLETCTIRTVTNEDLSMLLAWRNHPDVRSFMLTQHEIGVDEHRNWFARASQDPTRSLLIVEDDRQPVGYVQLNNVSPGGIADWGFYARPGAPRGSGRKLGISTLKYAFEDLELHKVCGQAIESNHASISFHRRLGFSQEGVLRDQHRINGIYRTLICFGLLEDEWRTQGLIL